MTDAPQGPQPKPGILDIAPYVGGKSSIAGVAEPGDFVVMLGAGSITQWAARLPLALEETA